MNKHKYKKNFIIFKPNFYFWDKFSILIFLEFQKALVFI